MKGKVIKLNDYKFNFGQETVYLNVFAFFKSKKSGNKYIIYSYDNKKLYAGSAFPRNNEIVVMISKSEKNSEIEDFTKKIFTNELSDYEIFPLDKINSVQIIDEKEYNFDIDLNQLYDITIPKEEVIITDTPKKKKSIVPVFIILFILVVALFFYLNPEVLLGKNISYVCTKTYTHDKLPASVNEKLELIFNSREVIQSIEVKSDYVFNDIEYYKEFRDNSYFYQYFTDGDTYKFDDSTYTYILFSNIDTKVDFFLPTSKDELIKHYQEEKYTCKVVEE